MSSENIRTSRKSGVYKVVGVDFWLWDGNIGDGCVTPVRGGKRLSFCLRTKVSSMPFDKACEIFASRTARGAESPVAITQDDDELRVYFFTAGDWAAGISAIFHGEHHGQEEW